MSKRNGLVTIHKTIQKAQPLQGDKTVISIEHNRTIVTLCQLCHHYHWNKRRNGSDDCQKQHDDNAT